MNRARSRSLRLALVVVATVSLATPARGQTVEAVGGTVLGAGAGAVVTMAVVVGGARSGRYLHSPGNARWELLPVPVGAAVGGVLGYRDPDALWRSAGWGAGGFAVGAAAGAVAGRILWGPSEGTWSGAVLGGAAGMVAGAVIGGLTAGGQGEPAAVPVQLRIPLGP